MQLTLRGVALYQDETADQRLFLEVLYNYSVSDFQGFSSIETSF